VPNVVTASACGSEYLIGCNDQKQKSGIGNCIDLCH